LFAKLEKDHKDVKGDVEEQASIVHDFGDSRSERVPWLELTAFPYHMTTLKDEEIWSSHKLPPKKELDAGSKIAKPVLRSSKDSDHSIVKSYNLAETQ